MLGDARHVDEFLTVKFLEAQAPRTEHVERLNRALALAREATRSAEEHLVHPPSPDPLYDEIRKAFFKGAGGGYSLAKAKIIGTLMSTSRGLSEKINISDVAGRGATLEKFAEGYTAFKGRFAKSIHLEFMLLGTWSQHAIARILIHEATHKFADTKDHAYMSDKGSWNGMNPTQAIENADSYAYAALSFYARKIVTFDTFKNAGCTPMPDMNALLERGKRPELPGASAAHAKAAS